MGPDLPACWTIEVSGVRHGRPGLLVERFDRVREGDEWVRLPLEDAAQVMGLSPAAKCNVGSEDVVKALAAVCKAPVVAARNLYLQFVFAWPLRLWT